MPTKTVLLIDDNREFSEMTKHWLTNTGKYTVITADNGRKGIDIARRKKPDVILLDVKMPVMDGGMVAEYLTEDESTSDIPIIFLTGLIMHEEVARTGGYIAGHPFIAKPFKMEDLTGMIEAVTTL